MSLSRGIRRHARLIAAVVVAGLIAVTLLEAALWIFAPTRGSDIDDVIRDAFSIADFSNPIWIDGLYSTDSYVQSVTLSSVRLAAPKMPAEAATRFVDWICSESFDEQRHQALTSQIAFLGRPTIEPALIAKCRAVLAQADGQESAGCSTRMCGFLVGLDKSYGAPCHQHEMSPSLPDALQSIYAARQQKGPDEATRP
jgi:hypothetical protein